jgi:hypothetical protein
MTNLKLFAKKTLPNSVLEFFLNTTLLNKIPKKNAVVSELFVFRISDDWFTFFELLNLNKIINPDSFPLKNYSIEIRFYNKLGMYLNSYSIESPKNYKTRVNINDITKKLKIYEDGTFAVFHDFKSIIISSNKSFLSERGYVGYENKRYGIFKSYVHGNYDAITKKGNNYLMLVNKSLYRRDYNLQLQFDYQFSYELFFVNPTNSIQNFDLNFLNGDDCSSEFFILQPRGSISIPVLLKYNPSRLVIKSNIYLARPIVFKFMKTSFDVFHG